MDLLKEIVQWLGMSRLELGFWSFPILLGLIFLRAPIGLAMFLCGLMGWIFAMNGNPTPHSRQAQIRDLHHILQLLA